MGSPEPVEGRCGAKLRGPKTGQFCTQPRVTGANRCRMHLGGPLHAKLQRDKVTSQARQLIPTELAAVTDPIQALLDLTAEALAFKDAVAGLVNARNGEIRFTDDKGAEQLRAEITVYERALDRAGRLLVDINRLGLEERLVQIRESEAQRMFAALQAALAAAGLDEEQQREARRVAGRHLRAVPAS